MGLDCTSDELAVVEAIDRFARRELEPRAAALDREAAFAGEHLPALAALGIMGLNLQERWGGPGVSAPALYRAVEALAGACASTASMVTAHYLATDAIAIGGDDALRERYLPGAADGTRLGAFALTEPAAGSNPADMRARAVASGDGYRITGTKHFISNAGHADFMVVFALTDPQAGHRGISAFVVEPAGGGVVAGPAEATMGLRGGHVFEVSLDCTVPAANRLGAEGTGFRTAMKTLDNGRIEVAAMCTGIARAAHRAALGWAAGRRVGGAPIGEFQGLRWMIADMATELEAARLLGLRAAALRAAGGGHTRAASMAKLFASEMVARVTDRALQIHGGYGYSADMALERYARDARIMRIYEGSSEIQRNIIAAQELRRAG